MSRAAQQVLVFVVGLVAMFGFVALIKTYGLGMEVVAVAVVVSLAALVVGLVVKKKKKL